MQTPSEADAPTINAGAKGKRRWWSATKEVLEVGAQIATAGGLFFVAVQTCALQNASKASIRGQLYEREAELFQQEDSEERLLKGSVWISVPASIRGWAYLHERMKPFRVEPGSLTEAQSPAAVWNLMYGVECLEPSTPGQEDTRRAMRQVHLYVSSNLYHVHSAFDYWQDGILDAGEWKTWRGLIANIGPHPLLLTAVWDGYRNNYFSRCFAEFLRSQLCPASAATSSDAEERRNYEFVREFYPEMTEAGWAARLPDYGNCEREE